MSFTKYTKRLDERIRNMGNYIIEYNKILLEFEIFVKYIVLNGHHHHYNLNICYYCHIILLL